MAQEINITEWLAKAKEDPKLFGQPVVIALAIFFAAFKGFYSPQKVLLDKQLKKNARIEKDINKVESAVKNIEDIKLEIEEQRAKWEKTQKLFYNKIEITKFLRRVKELGNKIGLKIRSVNPQPAEPLKIGEFSAEKLPVAFSFSGDLVTLGSFLRLVEKEEKLTFLTLPPLTPNASGLFEIELQPTAVVVDPQQATPEENDEEDE